jgi:hypothetical protein
VRKATFFVIAALVVWFVWQAGRTLDRLSARRATEIESVIK